MKTVKVETCDGKDGRVKLFAKGFRQPFEFEAKDISDFIGRLKDGDDATWQAVKTKAIVPFLNNSKEGWMERAKRVISTSNKDVNAGICDIVFSDVYSDMIVKPRHKTRGSGNEPKIMTLRKPDQVINHLFESVRNFIRTEEKRAKRILLDPPSREGEDDNGDEPGLERRPRELEFQKTDESELQGCIDECQKELCKKNRIRGFVLTQKMKGIKGRQGKGSKVTSEELVRIYDLGSVDNVNQIFNRAKHDVKKIFIKKMEKGGIERVGRLTKDEILQERRSH